MDRITKKDIERRVAYLATLIPHALHGKRLVYQEGSQTYGRAHRLYRQDLDHEGTPTGGLQNYFELDNGYLGWTAREAYMCVEGIIAAIRTQQSGESLS